MGNLTRACDVCGKPGFEIDLLPEVCPRCGWKVENLIGEPSKGYHAKLAKAREEWQAGGAAKVRAKRLSGLFEGIDTAWKAGRWVETLGYYDEILRIDTQNKRVPVERPVALFCLIESLLQYEVKTVQNTLRQDNKKENAALRKLRSDALEFESVGMDKEATDARDQAAVLDERIKRRTAEIGRLTSVIPDYFLKHYQQKGPASASKDQSTSFEKLLSAPRPEWSGELFLKQLWQPFVQQLSDLPPNELRHVEAFKTVYDKAVSALLSKRKRARAALMEARRLIERGSFSGVENLLAKAESLDSSLSGSVASAKSDLVSRRRSAAAAERDRRLASKRNWILTLKIIAIIAGAMAVPPFLIWAWHIIIIPLLKFIAIVVGLYIIGLIIYAIFGD